MAISAGLTLDAGLALLARSAETLRIDVEGISMAPSILPGDRLRLRPVPAREGTDATTGDEPALAPGDIVVLRGDDGLIVHRVLGHSQDHLSTHGDNTPRADPPMRKEALLGVVTAVERAGALDPYGFPAPAARAIALYASAAAALRWTSSAGSGGSPRRRLLEPPRAARVARALAGPQPRPSERALLALVALGIRAINEARRSLTADLAADGQAVDLVEPANDWGELAVDPDEPADERRASQVDLDEPGVVEAAHAAQLGPLAYVGFRAAAGSGAARRGPKGRGEVGDGLRRLYAAGLARSLEQAAIAAEILGALGAAGIPVLAHKGAALIAEPTGRIGAAEHGAAEHGAAEHGAAEHSTAEHGAAEHGTAEHGAAEHGTAARSTAEHASAHWLGDGRPGAVYPDPALRLAGDLDFCVRDVDRAEAERLAAKVRSRIVAANPSRRSLDGFHVELDGTRHHDIDLSGHGGGKWTSGRLDDAGIWERALPARLAGQQVLVPEPTDLMLTLGANCIRRGFSPCRVVADLAACVTRHSQAIDWDRATADMDRSGMGTRAWIAFDLAAAWFAAPIPPALCERPARLSLGPMEAAILSLKRRRPLVRVPTRILWSGGTVAAAGTLGRITQNEIVRRLR